MREKRNPRAVAANVTDDVTRYRVTRSLVGARAEALRLFSSENDFSSFHDDKKKKMYRFLCLSAITISYPYSFRGPHVSTVTVTDTSDDEFYFYFSTLKTSEKPSRTIIIITLHPARVLNRTRTDARSRRDDEKSTRKHVRVLREETLTFNRLQDVRTY